MKYTTNASGLYNMALPAATPSTTKPTRFNLASTITPVQFDRLKVDIASWRRACSEMEQSWYPHRVRVQRMYLDTILNGHVDSVWEKRKDLTLLRDFKLVKRQGSEWVPSEDLKAQFDEYTWFQQFLGLALDAQGFGYSLISLGNVINGDFEDITPVKRWNISPDREHVTSMIYMTDGKRWDDPEYAPWHIYIPTVDGNGISKCGPGIFYKIALYEIFLRNLLGYNGDFVELYAQPYRVGKTHKTSEDERAELERALQSMGSSGYAIIDPTDEIAFLETALGGTGWKGYENLEMRCQKLITKMVLGHADAMESVPGKLGASEGEASPSQMAMADKQTKDGKFIMPIVNRMLIPKMNELGFRIPEEYKWVLVNDDEKEQLRRRQDESNKITADIAQVMKNAGLLMDPKYFEERTGIPTEAAPEPEPMAVSGAPGGKPKPKSIKDQMEALYGK